MIRLKSTTGSTLVLGILATGRLAVRRWDGVILDLSGIILEGERPESFKPLEEGHPRANEGVQAAIRFMGAVRLEDGAGAIQHDRFGALIVKITKEKVVAERARNSERAAALAWVLQQMNGEALASWKGGRT